jgi:hypothetical protein
MHTLNYFSKIELNVSFDGITKVHSNYFNLIKKLTSTVPIHTLKHFKSYVPDQVILS